MPVGKLLVASIAAFGMLSTLSPLLNASPRKVHVVARGAVRRVPYSKTGDPAGAPPGENALKIRPLIAQVAARKPVPARKVAPFDPTARTESACATTEWQREPLRVTFHPAGTESASFGVVSGSAILVEDSENEPETSSPTAKN